MVGVHVVEVVGVAGAWRGAGVKVARVWRGAADPGSRPRVGRSRRLGEIAPLHLTLGHIATRAVEAALHTAQPRVLTRFLAHLGDLWVVRYGKVRCGAVWCGMARCGAVRCGAVCYGAVRGRVGQDRAG